MVFVGSFSVLTLFFFGCGTSTSTNSSTGNKDITPADNQTTITLDDGSKMIVDAYEAEDGAVAAKSILAEAKKSFSADVELHYFSGYVLTLFMTDGEINYGGDKGKYPEWYSTLYSPSKKESALATWSSGKVSIGDPYGSEDPTYGDLEAQVPAIIPEDIITSQAAYQTALSAGLDDKTYLVEMKLDNSELFGGTPVWSVVEESKTEKDEYDLPAIIKTYSIDALTGEVR